MERASWATMNGSERIVDVEDARLALGALWTPGSTAISARAGIRPGPGNPGRVTASTPTPDGKVRVAAFQGVLAASRGHGSYGTTLDADKEIDILTPYPADPSNDRIDLIAEVQRDTFYGDPATAYEVTLVVGDPAAAPVDPIDKITSPDYRIRARVRVPAGATAITSAEIENFSTPWTVAVGGVLPVFSKAERDALDNPHSGMAIYRYDKDWPEYWDGSGWRVRGLVTVTALADITHPYTDQLVIYAGDDMLYRWTGSTWLAVLHTATGGGYAMYSQSTPQVNAAIAATWVKQQYPAATYTTPDVSPNVAFEDWTLNRGGVWEIEAGNRIAPGGGASTVRFLYAVFPSGTGFGSSPYRVDTTYEPDAANNSTNLNISLRRRFAAGDKVSIGVRRDGVPPSGGGNNSNSEISGEQNHISLRWVGP